MPIGARAANQETVPKEKAASLARCKAGICTDFPSGENIGQGGSRDVSISRISNPSWPTWLAMTLSPLLLLKDRGGEEGNL